MNADAGISTHSHRHLQFAFLPCSFFRSVLKQMKTECESIRTIHFRYSQCEDSEGIEAPVRSFAFCWSTWKQKRVSLAVAAIDSVPAVLSSRVLTAIHTSPALSLPQCFRHCRTVALSHCHTDLRFVIFSLPLALIPTLFMQQITNKHLFFKCCRFHKCNFKPLHCRISNQLIDTSRIFFPSTLAQQQQHPQCATN